MNLENMSCDAKLITRTEHGVIRDIQLALKPLLADDICVVELSKTILPLDLFDVKERRSLRFNLNWHDIEDDSSFITKLLTTLDVLELEPNVWYHPNNSKANLCFKYSKHVISVRIINRSKLLGLIFTYTNTKNISDLSQDFYKYSGFNSYSSLDLCAAELYRSIQKYNKSNLMFMSLESFKEELLNISEDITLNVLFIRFGRPITSQSLQLYTVNDIDSVYQVLNEVNQYSHRLLLVSYIKEY